MGPMAQSVEQRTFNPWVDDSKSTGPIFFEHESSFLSFSSSPRFFLFRESAESSFGKTSIDNIKKQFLMCPCLMSVDVARIGYCMSLGC